MEALYDDIKNNIITEAYVKEKLGSGEIYRYVSSTVDDPPSLVVVIDEKTRELEEACNSIPILEKRVLEFKVFERVDAGIKNAFVLEPLVVKLKSVVKPKSPQEPPKGEITPQSEYDIPILETLIEMGGRGNVRDVLDKVYEKMKNKLTPTDLSPLPSGGKIRWKNYTRWARQSLKEEGYLRSDSPRGVWEITDKGRAYYHKS